VPSRLRSGLAAGLLVVAGLTPAAAGDPERGLRAYTVVDAAGTPLGQAVQALGPAAMIAVKGNGDVGLFLVAANRIAQGTSLVVFESADCTGPPFFPVPVGSPGLVPMFVQAGLAGLPDRLILETGPEVEIVRGSRWNTFLAVPACVTVPAGPPVPALPGATLLDLSTVAFPLSPAGPADWRPGAGRDDRRPLELVDGNGRVVGPLYPNFLPYDGVALIRAGGRAGLVSVARSGFLSGIGNGASYTAAYHESTDCSGPALIAPPDPAIPPGFLEVTALLQDGSLVTGQGSPASREVQSTWVGQTCTPIAPVSMSLRETEAFYDLGQHPPPFRPR
jgi:hypothetical protein